MAESEKKMTTKEGIAGLRAFLESTPPNVPQEITNLLKRQHPNSVGNPWSFVPPQIHLFCEADGGFRWFLSPTDYIFVEKREWKFLTYRCRNCGGPWKTYALVIETLSTGPPDVEVMKLGEYPPFGAPISARIEKLLGEKDLELYRKGMRSEAQGLGIGAATYFRRIVDDQWKQLVGEIREAAVTLGYEDVSIFDKAMNETQFSKAVDMLKDAIPPKLLILNGDNPLTLLYHPLSVQLHDLTDEECLQQAGDIRLVLTALLENIADVLKDQEELKSAAERLKSRKP